MLGSRAVFAITQLSVCLARKPHAVLPLDQVESRHPHGCARPNLPAERSPATLLIPCALRFGAVLLLLGLQVGQVSAEHPELCERCLPVVDALGFKLPGTAAAAPAAAEKAAAAV